MPSTILRPLFLSLKNKATSPSISQRQKRRDRLLILFTLLTMLLCYLGTRMLLVSVSGDPLFDTIFPPRILQLVFFAFFILLVFSSTVSATGILYFADNMDLLLRAPITRFQLFTAKLIHVMLETCLMYFIFIVPMLLAYVHILNLNYNFLFLTLLVSLPFLIIPNALGIIFATFFVNASSFLWKRGILLFIVFASTATWALLEFMTILGKVQIQQGGTHAIVKLIGIFQDPNPVWLPSAWIADIALVYLGEDVHSIWIKLSLLFLTATGTVALAFLFFDFFLLRVRSSALTWDSSKKSKKSKDLLRSIIEVVVAYLPVERYIKAIMIKDLTCLVRDRSQALQLLLFLGLAAFYIAIFKFMGNAVIFSPTAEDMWKAFLAAVNVVLAGFIITAVMTRLVYPSISLEGNSFWILQVAPIKIEQLLLAKFVCWFPIVITLMSFLMISAIVAIGLPWATILSMIVLCFCLALGCTGLAVGFGATFANFEWESPNQIIAGLGTLTLLGCCILLVITTAIPATFLILVSSVEIIRSNLGIAGSLLLMFLTSFGALFINVLAAKIALERGINALKERQYSLA